MVVTPSASHVLGDNQQFQFNITYYRHRGTLKVTTKTDDGRDLPAGAGWTVGNKPGDYAGNAGYSHTYASGTKQHDHNDEYAETGDYSINVNDLDGWTESVSLVGASSVGPAANSGTLIKNEGLEFEVTYTRHTGYFGVTTRTSDGSELPAGAGWELTGHPGDYLGQTMSNYSGGEVGPQLYADNVAATGTFNLEGKPVANWSHVVTVDASGPRPATASESGELEFQGKVEFTVTYTQQLGELEVIILPESIRPQAGWRQPGQVAFKKSWPKPEGTENLIQGYYDVEFSDVDGWFAPASQMDVQVNAGTKTTITAIYTENPAGSLQVFMEDNLDDRVKNMGAQWQPVLPTGSEVGTALAGTWYNSGDTITGIEPGDVGLRFKTVSGFILPELSGASVEADKKTVATGEYYRQLIIHKSDYNGDGTDDLAVFDGDSATWSVASIGKPAGAPSKVNLFETRFGKADDIPTAGDYDGDGVADLAYWREATGEWRVNKQFKLKNFGQINDIPVPGDYNGDGMTDPALYRPSTGEWIIYNVETKKTTKVAFGDLADVPVPGNYNADQAGMTDLAVYNVETNKWRVAIYDANKQKWIEKRKVKVNGKKIKLKTAHGAVGNVPVQADYDGDGATDLAVYVRGSSEWNIRGSELIQLGAKGDVPVPNDWAGLGRVIPTIFHPQNGRWLAIDNLLRTKHGKGGQPLMSGR